jgi:hypothetical protein
MVWKQDLHTFWGMLEGKADNVVGHVETRLHGIAVSTNQLLRQNDVDSAT